jgi:hypothetical protein
MEELTVWFPLTLLVGLWLEGYYDMLWRTGRLSARVGTLGERSDGVGTFTWTSETSKQRRGR